jgi:hypothetical protein
MISAATEPIAFKIVAMRSEETFIVENLISVECAILKQNGGCSQKLKHFKLFLVKPNRNQIYREQEGG